MALVKGSVFGPRLNYLKSHGSPEQEQAVMESLSEPARQALRHVIVSQWYPFEHYIELNRAIVKIMGKGDIEILHEVGRCSADEALNGIYKLFFKVGSPNVIIKSAVRAWNQYFQNGELSVEILGPKKLTMVFSRVEDLAREHFIATKGWVQRVLELSGGTNVRVKLDKLDPARTTLDVAWE